MLDLHVSSSLINHYFWLDVGREAFSESSILQLSWPSFASQSAWHRGADVRLLVGREGEEIHVGVKEGEAECGDVSRASPELFHPNLETNIDGAIYARRC